MREKREEERAGISDATYRRISPWKRVRFVRWMGLSPGDCESHTQVKSEHRRTSHSPLKCYDAARLGFLACAPEHTRVSKHQHLKPCSLGSQCSPHRTQVRRLAFSLCGRLSVTFVEHQLDPGPCKSGGQLIAAPTSPVRGLSVSVQTTRSIN